MYASAQVADRLRRGRLSRNVLATCCLLTTICIYYAGLKPFKFSAQSDVTWLQGESGLRFGENATVYTLTSFPGVGAPEGGPCTLELWAEAESDDHRNTLLAFYSPANSSNFRLEQSASDFLALRDLRDEHSRLRTQDVTIEHLFQERQPVFITLVSRQGRGVTAYVNGVVVKQDSYFPFSLRDLHGQLILGTAPTHYATWSGKLLGLAVYDRELDPEQVSQNYRAAIREKRLGPALGAAPLALFPFDEGSGNIVHNHGFAGVNLYVPRRFEVLHKPVLDNAVEEFHLSLGYFKDVLINVTGFIPFGFFCQSLFSYMMTRRKAIVLSVLLGVAISLSIELSQVFIPQRSSSMTDLLANTFGTILGVALCGMFAVSNILKRLVEPQAC